MPFQTTFASSRAKTDCPRSSCRIDSEVRTVYLHGSHVTDFRLNAHDQPLLWLSPDAVYENGTAIRGGVPVCWPWFGPHPSDATKPSHGFARNRPWAVVESCVHGDEVTVWFQINSDESTLGVWPHEFRTTYSVSLSDRLAMQLDTVNTGRQSMKVGGALHSYFQVSDIQNATVDFGQATEYLDQLEGMQKKTQKGAVVFDREVDRIYLPKNGEVFIRDSGFNRQICIRSQGSRSTVVWNPWIDKAKRMGDFPDDGYQSMLCVETANAIDDVRTVEPSETHTLTQTISLA